MSASAELAVALAADYVSIAADVIPFANTAQPAPNTSVLEGIGYRHSDQAARHPNPEPNQVRWVLEP
jgi:hypothetical protein